MMGKDNIIKAMLYEKVSMTPNEKICFTVMFENPYIEWTAEEIKRVAENNNLFVLHENKIEESIDRHLNKNSKTDALVSCEIKGNRKFDESNYTDDPESIMLMNEVAYTLRLVFIDAFQEFCA